MLPATTTAEPAVPVASATLALEDAGVLRLADPVTRWLPELADRRVLRDPVGPLDDTGPADRDITVRDLLTSQSDVTVLEVKDYIAEPKENGYKSLHAIVEVPVFLSGGSVDV